MQGGPKKLSHTELSKTRIKAYANEVRLFSVT